MRRLLGRLSLRARLLVMTAVLLLVGLSLISAIVTNRLETYQVEQVDDQLDSVTTIISRVPEATPDEIESSVDRPELLESGLEALGVPYLVYFDEHGNVTTDVHAPTLDAESLPSHDELRAIDDDGAAVDVAAADGSGRWRAVGHPTTGRDGTVVAATPMIEADATMDRLRAASMIGGVVVLIVLTVVGWFALGRGLRPLRRIERTAAAIADGDLTERVPALAPPSTEIGRLAGSLNTMLGQLDRAFTDQAASETRMRTFLADVSHELRTPLVGIKGSTELYRMGALTERADIDEAMDRIDREATRLNALTEDLLLLAQLDEAPEGQLDRAPMDLRTLANDARHDLHTLDPSRPVELTGLTGLNGSGQPGAAPVDADEARLRQVVTNFVGNAAAHTPPGTAVRIGVGALDGRAVLEVADDGPGMAPEQASRAFDRFYRANRSRNRSAGASAGLGLSIARSLARAHGGDVELDTALGAGARFRLVLPLLHED
ncbi:sensor histidine kinase [Solicola gregarius]|uniref:histidine kinase n=1 Tax=Solicola gregarius TaxID=2908642 RepID=A0AA46YK09_9ACTN|nr:HAMP domain-containing sensor histidine kinase [Solicola gregarius]UYM03538.1 HAMP domain-containing histidine kinase [Solicola gregarius]